MSPDEKYLYIGSGGKILRYDIQANDLAANGRVLLEANTDGMKADQKGNLYLTTGNVLIVSPEGKRLGEIRLPGEPGGNRALNVGFGDSDAKTLFIAAQSKLYRVRLNVPGTRPAVRYWCSFRLGADTGWLGVMLFFVLSGFLIAEKRR